MEITKRTARKNSFKGAEEITRPMDFYNFVRDFYPDHKLYRTEAKIIMTYIRRGGYNFYSCDDGSFILFRGSYVIAECLSDIVAACINVNKAMIIQATEIPDISQSTVSMLLRDECLLSRMHEAFYDIDSYGYEESAH